MTRDEFYCAKSLVRTDWWLDSSCLPTAVVWARLRIYDDRATDVRFEDGSKIYGFKNEQYAEYFLAEDEFICLSKVDSDDAVEYGVVFSTLLPPTWRDEPEDFEYLGTY